MENKLVNKLINNKVFLFIVPNLIFFLRLFDSYNNNIDNIGEVLFYEILLLGGLMVLVNCFISLFLKKALKDEHKVFCMLCFISIFYFLQFSFVYFLLFIVFILILVFSLKKFVNFKFDFIVTIVSFVIIALFTYNFGTAAFNSLYVFLCDKEYDYELDIEVDEELDTPNIYWIHCDGMLGFESMDKYFNYGNDYLKKYLNENNYIYTDDAKLVAGHRTQTALTAMFNPYYYDNFFRDYLYELEDSFINEKKNSFIVSYYEIEEKRLNNELFQALDEKDYTTVAIADFNQYTGFYTDYFYDYFVFDKFSRHVVDKKELRYMDNKDVNSNKLLSYMRFNQSKVLINTTMFYPILKDFSFIDYEVKDYEKLPSDYEFQYMNDTNYWVGKGIVKSIEETTEIEGNKFMFIDFKLNHFPVTFNAYGEFIDYAYAFDLNNYTGNYDYSVRLLAELLDYIKYKDEDAVIFVQGDHGVHVFEDEVLMKWFKITKEEAYSEIMNSVVSAYYIPDKYKNGDGVCKTKISDRKWTHWFYCPTITYED